MNKKLLALAITGVVALTLPYSVNAKENAVKPSVEYSQFVTQRQVVDQLLEEALTAFKSPARVSHAGFT
ncbi:transporter, partial [Vibrio cholerae]|nr:transporter [Vibrio cholerae]